MKIKKDLRNQPQRRAFTLTELLVTLAILGILSSLAAAAVLRSKSSAHQAQCLANLRELGVGLSNFTLQHDEFPLSMNPGFFQGAYEHHLTSWKGALANKDGLGQVSGTNAFRFDTDSGVWKCPGAKIPPAWPNQLVYSYYGYNAYGLGDSGVSLGLGGVSNTSSNGLARPVKTAEVLHPSQMIAIGDGFVGWGSAVKDGSNVIRCHASAIDQDGSTARSLRRHRGRAIACLVDGHTEAIPFPRLFSGEGESARALWNRDGR